MSMNAIHIVGNLGNDVEVKQKADNTNYWKINVATSEKWNDKATGERKELTTWHTCVLYGNYTNLAQYLRKGTTVAITGKMRLTKYELKDKQGNAVAYADGTPIKSVYPFIIVQNISLVGGRSEAAPQQAAPQEQPQQPQSPPPASPEEDLPF